MWQQVRSEPLNISAISHRQKDVTSHFTTFDSSLMIRAQQLFIVTGWRLAWSATSTTLPKNTFITLNSRVQRMCAKMASKRLIIIKEITIIIILCKNKLLKLCLLISVRLKVLTHQTDTKEHVPTERRLTSPVSWPCFALQHTAKTGNNSPYQQAVVVYIRHSTEATTGRQTAWYTERRRTDCVI